MSDKSIIHGYFWRFALLALTFWAILGLLVCTGVMR